MDYSWIISERPLNELHQEVKETRNIKHIQELQMEKNQKELLEKIQLLQSNLYLNYISQNLFGADMKKTIIPFFEKEIDLKIIENIEEYGLNRRHINQFFNLLTNNLDKFATTVDFNKIPETSDLLPFIPFDFSPLQYILYSTLPSIFGYCWCSELAESYIDFIFKAALENPTFKESYLVLSFTNFIKVSAGPAFFRETMEKPFFDLVRTSYGKIKKEKLFFYAKQILTNMKEKVSLLPRHVRRITRRFFNESESKIMTPEQFTVRSMILPALKQPKEWGILEQTVHISSMCTNNLNELSDIFSESTENTETQKLLCEFVAECKKVDERSDLLFVSQVLPLMSCDNLHIVLSLPDIFALSFLVQNSDVSAFLQGAAEFIPKDKEVPIKFVQMELKEFSQYQISTSDAQDMNITDNNTLTLWLFKFFELANICDSAPNDLTKFLEFHKKKADTTNDTSIQFIIKRVFSIFPKEDTEEWEQIIPSLEDELQREKAVISLGDEALTKLATLSHKFEKFTKNLNALAESQKAIMYSQFFSLFIHSNLDIKETFEMRSLGYAYNVDMFYKMFESVSQRLRDFVGEKYFSKIALNLHTWMMMQIPFNTYLTSHNQYEEDDKALENPPKEFIDIFCIQPAPENVKELFNYKEVFEDAKNLLMSARYSAVPLISLVYINKCIDKLNKLFIIEYGCSAQADELTPLIHYLLLTSHIPNLIAFTNYMDEFLFTLKMKDLIDIEEGKVVGLTHLINHIQSFVEISHSEDITM